MTPSVSWHVLYELSFFYANDLPLCIKSPGETRGWLAIQSGRQPDTLFFFFLSTLQSLSQSEQLNKVPTELWFCRARSTATWNASIFQLDIPHPWMLTHLILNLQIGTILSEDYRCVLTSVWPLIFKEKLRPERMNQWSCGWSWKRSRLSSAIGNRAVNFVVWDFFPYRKVMGTNNPPAVPR